MYIKSWFLTLKYIAFNNNTNNVNKTSPVVRQSFAIKRLSILVAYSCKRCISPVVLTALTWFRPVQFGDRADQTRGRRVLRLLIRFSMVITLYIYDE